ncbi:energy transducer TonB [Vogesella indigofera]|uniref:energy transducer TonB n=1 Tax=Vogesella indigofera TaxID=45465 RepID=UPI00234F072E|nr:energy transducer TonB [Vogesella indigofera]MDC7708120.1 energy transducer TonB [Vogesella indigofera]
MRAALLLSLALHALLLAAFAWQFRPLPALTPPLQVLLLSASLPAEAVMAPQRGGERAVAPSATRPAVAAEQTPTPIQAPIPAARRATPAAAAPAQTSATPPATALAAGKAAATGGSAPASSSSTGSNAAANLAPAAVGAASPPALANGNTATGGEKTGESRAVRVRFSPKPPYPALSRELGEEGVVLLRISVGVGGEFEQVQLLRSSGFVRLDRAARDGVRSWRFDAAWQAGQPVADSIDIPVRFRLDEL